MARKASQLIREQHDLLNGPALGIKAGLGEPLLLIRNAAGGTARQREDQALDLQCVQPQRLADIAQGAALAIADDGRRQAGPMTTILFIDVLDDLLASLMLEIDIDVGRLRPLLADEPFKKNLLTRR